MPKYKPLHFGDNIKEVPRLSLRGHNAQAVSHAAEQQI